MAASRGPHGNRDAVEASVHLAIAAWALEVSSVLQQASDFAILRPELVPLDIKQLHCRPRARIRRLTASETILQDNLFERVLNATMSYMKLRKLDIAGIL